MRIVVCVKQTAADDLNPYDACAYEAVLQIPDGEVTLLSIGPDMRKCYPMKAGWYYRKKC